MYVLTPQGVAENASLAAAFLSRGLEKCEVLRQEIVALKDEINSDEPGGGAKA